MGHRGRQTLPGAHQAGEAPQWQGLPPLQLAVASQSLGPGPVGADPGAHGHGGYVPGHCLGYGHHRFPRRPPCFRLHPSHGGGGVSVRRFRSRSGRDLESDAGQGLRLVRAGLPAAAQKGLGRHESPVQMVLWQGRAAQVRPLDLLGEVRLLGGVLGSLHHRPVRYHPVVLTLLQPLPAGLGLQPGHPGSRTGGFPGGDDPVRGALLQQPLPAQQVSSGPGDVHRPLGPGGIQGRTPRALQAPQGKRRTGEIPGRTALQGI